MKNFTRTFLHELFSVQLVDLSVGLKTLTLDTQNNTVYRHILGR
jgi:hypothetical protein